MNIPNDGGPAFQNSAVMNSTTYADGMSLRDYFAAKATWEEIISIMPSTQGEIMDWIGETDKFSSAVHMPKACAKARMILADAMLSERQKYIHP